MLLLLNRSFCSCSRQDVCPDISEEEAEKALDLCDGRCGPWLAVTALDFACCAQCGAVLRAWHGCA